MDNVALVRTFVEQIVEQKPCFLYNSELRVEPVSDALQLVASSGGLVAVSHTSDEVPQIAVRHQSPYWNMVHTVMAESGFLPTGKSRMAGFYEYQKITVPSGYQVRFTDALDILQAWCSYNNPEKVRPVMAMLILHRGHWYAIQDLTSQQGTLLIHTLKDTLKLYPLDRVIWLQKRTPHVSPAESHNPLSEVQHQANSTDSSDPPECLEPVPLSRSKKIGNYLVEAALLTSAQAEVALCDQRATGLRFGEILVKRGWLKEETIEFLMHNVILPQRAAARRRARMVTQRIRKHVTRNVETPPPPSPPSSHAANVKQSISVIEPDGERSSTPVLTETPNNRETLITSEMPDFIDLPPHSSPALHSRETLNTQDLDLEHSHSLDESERRQKSEAYES